MIFYNEGLRLIVSVSDACLMSQIVFDAVQLQYCHEVPC